MSQLERRAQQAITLGELISKLEELRDDLELSEDTPICIGYDYGDHTHSQVRPIANDAGVGLIKWSDYHNMPKDAGDPDNEEGTLQVIVIQ